MLQTLGPGSTLHQAKQDIVTLKIRGMFFFGGGCNLPWTPLPSSRMHACDLGFSSEGYVPHAASGFVSTTATFFKQSISETSLSLRLSDWSRSPARAQAQTVLSVGLLMLSTELQTCLRLGLLGLNLRYIHAGRVQRVLGLMTCLNISLFLVSGSYIPRPNASLFVAKSPTLARAPHFMASPVPGTSIPRLSAWLISVPKVSLNCTIRLGAISELQYRVCLFPGKLWKENEVKKIAS